jgi:hypothetical protein
MTVQRRRSCNREENSADFLHSGEKIFFRFFEIPPAIGAAPILPSAGEALPCAAERLPEKSAG